MIAFDDIPLDVNVLHLARCQDCRRWDKLYGRCYEVGLSQYIPREEYHPAMRRFWTDLGMIRLDEWHYCKFYEGPRHGTPLLMSQTTQEQLA